ncbi:hypothetical protein Cha6605_4298 [Chamaesiphon minutus PCC 6605]|uniref:Uncharacterized protein n=1 Tax=Chamaesiphon minutus (strain ATCC 27169 / PCC 6605) TaxID=1173020 RepID=K9UKQ3_CHAP6|nr:hypothetical protein Cha6605_4298 [Chamaesiphon minutus PCC 6605]
MYTSLLPLNVAAHCENRANSGTFAAKLETDYCKVASQNHVRRSILSVSKKYRP